MENTFQYSILKYIHSPYLGEGLNLGILFYFPENKKLVFRAPEKLNRIKAAYPDFNEELINQYIKNFYKTAENLNVGLKEKDVNDIANTYFLPKDDSVLQFLPFEIGLTESSSLENIINDYYQLYFAPYKTEQIVNPKLIKNERYILSQFHKIIHSKYPEKTKFFKSDFELISEKTKLKADYFWKNNSGNLIKAVSFDLKDSSALNDKAILYSAKLNYLAEEAEKNNLRVDLFITKPSNPSLFGEFENSLGIIQESSINKKIILEAEIEVYTKYATDNVVLF